MWRRSFSILFNVFFVCVSAAADEGPLKRLSDQAARLYLELDSIHQIYPQARQSYIALAKLPNYQAAHDVTIRDTFEVQELYFQCRRVFRARLDYWPIRLAVFASRLEQAVAYEEDPDFIIALYGRVHQASERTLALNKIYIEQLYGIPNVDVARVVQLQNANLELTQTLDLLREDLSYRFLAAPEYYEEPWTWGDRFGSLIATIGTEGSLATTEVETSPAGSVDSDPQGLSPLTPADTLGRVERSTEAVENTESTDLVPSIPNPETSEAALEEAEVLPTPPSEGSVLVPSSEGDNSDDTNDEGPQLAPTVLSNVVKPVEELASETQPSNESVLVVEEDEILPSNLDFDDNTTLRLVLLKELQKKETLTESERSLKANLEKWLRENAKK